MKLRALLASVFFLALLSAGDGQAADSGAAPADVTATAAAACAAGSATLPVTGLCQDQAAALMFAAPGEGPTAPDDCTWVIAEAKMPDGALLYRTAKCPAGTARIEFVPGTPTASFEVVESPYPNDMGRWKLIFLLDAPDGKATVLAEARRGMEDKTDAARCQVRPAMEGWPADAFVIDEVPAKAEDDIRSTCGEFGVYGGTTEFWRLSQGRGWFFRFGEETPIVDAESVTLVKRDAGGNWVRA